MSYINRFYKKIIDFCNLFAEFGLKAAWNIVILPSVPILGNHEKRFLKKDKYITELLYDKYNHIFNECRYDKLSKVEKNKNVVWIFWWQGENQMPKLVKACYNSIIKNAPKNSEVILITKNNYTEYIDLPNFILDKFNAGIITITHFSDIIRTCLLCDYGGLWLDATIYLSCNLDSRIFDRPFISWVGPDNDWFDPKCYWCGFAIGGYRYYPLFKIMKDFWFAYWEEHNVMIGFYLIDYVISTCYHKNMMIRNDIDNYSLSGENIFYMANHLNDSLGIKEYMALKQKTDLNKLSYKININTRKKNKLYDMLLSEV